MRAPFAVATLVAMASGNELAVNLADVNVARRLRFGIAALGLGLVLAVTLERSGASPGLRWVLLAPFFLSANAFFQGMFRTCGFSAWAGFRHRGGVRERIADTAELRSVRAQGLKQVGYAIVTATALTGSFVMVA